VRVDASLVVGAAAQSVEVTGQTALLQTEAAEVRSEFTTRRLVLKVESVKRFRQPGNSRFDSTSLPVRRTAGDLGQTSSFETGG
jgi:hypothetical protein